jgi:hypothetical protein
MGGCLVAFKQACERTTDLHFDDVTAQLERIRQALVHDGMPGASHAATLPAGKRTCPHTQCRQQVRVCACACVLCACVHVCLCVCMSVCVCSLGQTALRC